MMQNINEKEKRSERATTSATTSYEVSSRASETMSAAPEQEASGEAVVDDEPKPKSLAFWLIFAALCLCGLLGALEATVTSTALPTIASVLGSGELFIWVINGYYLTSYVLPIMDCVITDTNFTELPSFHCSAR